MEAAATELDVKDQLGLQLQSDFFLEQFQTLDSRFGTVKAAEEHHFKLSGLPIAIQETFSQLNFEEALQLQAEVIQGGIVKLEGDQKYFRRNRNTDNLGKLKTEQLKKPLHEEDQAQQYQTFQVGDKDLSFEQQESTIKNYI